MYIYIHQYESFKVMKYLNMNQQIRKNRDPIGSCFRAEDFGIPAQSQ